MLTAIWHLFIVSKLVWEFLPLSQAFENKPGFPLLEQSGIPKKRSFNPDNSFFLKKYI